MKKENKIKIFFSNLHSLPCIFLILISQNKAEKKKNIIYIYPLCCLYKKEPFQKDWGNNLICKEIF